MGTLRKRNHSSGEKSKGKLRRDNAGKLARFAREEERQQNYPETIYKGSCEPESCLGGIEEVGCVPINNNTEHYCVCTSNGMPHTHDVKCPRSTVPVTPVPIHNIIPPTTSNTSAESRSASHSVSYVRSETANNARATFADSAEVTQALDVGLSKAGSGAPIGGVTGAGLILFTAGSLVFLVLIVTIVVFCIRRKTRTVDGKTQPRRPGEPLLAERYITNPQYGVYGAGAGPASAGPAPEDGGEQVPCIDRNALTFLEEVGEGCFGKVHRGLLRATSGEHIVAIKVLKESVGRSAEEDFVREVSIMSAFKHPNILTLIGVVHREDIGASPWMVFEYMKWGDLAGVLRGSKGGGRPGPHLDEPALLHVALQVARGMQYLAARHFVHRDLAARNCLVGDNLTVKIADFGMSRDVYTCDYYKMGGERPMPVRWMSPESIVYARFTHESDVWSYGVVLWEIYSRGKQPFYGYNNDGATKRILQGIVLVPPEDCPRFACELMRACWKTDPRERIGFDEICRKLDVAAASGGAPPQMRLPCPPPPSQDSAGYLIPNQQPPADYFRPLPEPEHDTESDSSEEEEEEYT